MSCRRWHQAAAGPPGDLIEALMGAPPHQPSVAPALFRVLALVKSSTAPADREVILDMARTTARYGGPQRYGRGWNTVPLVEALRALPISQTCPQPLPGSTQRPTHLPIRPTRPARSALTCSGAGSGQSSRNPRTRSPTASAWAVAAAARRPSIATPTSSGTLLSGASTNSSNGVAWPLATTRPLPSTSPDYTSPPSSSGHRGDPKETAYSPATLTARSYRSLPGGPGSYGRSRRSAFSRTRRLRVTACLLTPSSHAEFGGYAG